MGEDEIRLNKKKPSVGQADASSLSAFIYWFVF